MIGVCENYFCIDLTFFYYALENIRNIVCATSLDLFNILYYNHAVIVRNIVKKKGLEDKLKTFHVKRTGKKF